MLEGELTFYLEDGQPIPALAGSFVHIPKGMAHAFQVDSKTARFLDLTAPQHEHFMRAAGEPAQGRVLPPAGPPDMEKVGALPPKSTGSSSSIRHLVRTRPESGSAKLIR